MRFSFVFGLGLVLLPSSGCFSEPSDAQAETEGAGAASTGAPGGTDPAGGDVETSEGGSDSTTGLFGAESTGTTGTFGGSSSGLASSTGWVTTESSGAESSTGADTGADTGGETAVCGNGVREGEEACDEGPRPPLTAGACRPTCDGIIPTRELRLSVTSTAGDLASDPVATMDALCPAGYRALFAYGETRRATIFGNESNTPIDWVLHPYTAYVNANGDTIWVTDATPLLGLRAGVLEPLEHAIVPYEDNPPGALTGMNSDWTTATGSDDDCLGWTSDLQDDLHTSGVPWIVTGGAFLNNGGYGGCDQPNRAYCVEQ